MIQDTPSGHVVKAQKKTNTHIPVSRESQPKSSAYKFTTFSGFLTTKADVRGTGTQIGKLLLC